MEDAATHHPSRYHCALHQGANNLGMNLALFDFDGTITKTEMCPDFMRLTVYKHRLFVGNASLVP
jgi:hypothetical protein